MLHAKLNSNFKESHQEFLNLPLSTTSRPVLPPDLNQQHAKSLSIPLPYILELCEILDITRSKYSQIEFENSGKRVIVQAEEESKENEQQMPNMSSNTLKLQLTDGFVQVTALALCSLPTTLPLGTKILIKEHLQVKRGLLILLPNQFQILGGCVKEWNSLNYQNRLKLALGFPMEKETQSQQKEKIVIDLE